MDTLTKIKKLFNCQKTNNISELIDMDYPIVKFSTCEKILKAMSDPNLDQISMNEALKEIFSKL